MRERHFRAVLLLLEEAIRIFEEVPLNERYLDGKALKYLRKGVDMLRRSLRMVQPVVLGKVKGSYICVILIATETRPTPRLLEDAYAANGDGAGIAWREEGKVHWKKGLDLDRFKQLCADVPLPFIGHCRIASIGGVRASLTHPFPVSARVPLALEGTTTGAVVFHNGHWGEWSKELKQVILASGGKYQIPPGVWSDSRAIAFMVHVYGMGILDLLNEKTVGFSPKECEVAGYGWDEIDGITVSNTFFKNRAAGFRQGQTYPQNYTSPMCKDRRCTRRDVDKVTGFCPDHQVREVRVGGSEVAPEPTPFEVACRLFSEGRATEVMKLVDSKKLSKKQMKKARKRWESLILTSHPMVVTH